MGHDHQLVGESSGLESLQNDRFASTADTMDFSKPDEVDIECIIGGDDSPWACVEVVATGKSKVIYSRTICFSYFTRASEVLLSTLTLLNN